MRLSDYQKQNIIHIIRHFVADNKAELRLYGSRVDDHKKGGDIDLLLITHSPEVAAKLKQIKPEILLALSKKLGERRIDLLIANTQEIEQDNFIQMVLPNSIVLTLDELT